ncbi:MAG: DUF928 domain-containing protein [Cyanobacteria bacterium P01_A01_bin.83]
MKPISLLNLLLLIFSQIFLWAVRAEAGLLGNYTPSSNPTKVEQRRTVGSGSRSNCKSDLPKNSLTLLVPEANVVHHTSSPAPPLFLHSKVASSLPLKFTLVNPQVAEPVVEQTFSVSQPGVKQLQLPKSTNLKEGTVYLWYVAIPCHQDSQEYYEVLGAAVKRVPLEAKVRQQLEKSNTKEETAAVYATNGIWYEALSFAIQDRDRPEYLQQLLSNVGLVPLNEKDKAAAKLSFR